MERKKDPRLPLDYMVLSSSVVERPRLFEGIETPAGYRLVKPRVLE